MRQNQNKKGRNNEDVFISYDRRTISSWFGTEPDNTPQALAVQSNGQIVVGDFVADASPVFGGIARLDTNGELDTTFGNGGRLTIDNSVTALLIDTNGDILAIEATGNDGIVVAAYLAN